MEVRGKISSTGFKKVSETRGFDAGVSIATPAEKPEI
jgi:hypothetical protein